MNTILRLLFVSIALGVASARAQTPAGPTGTAASDVLAGAFQVGDRVLLRAEGDSALSGTFAVGPGPALTLPETGEVRLIGVRRADVEASLGRGLAGYLREPVLQARALIRLSL